MSGGYNRWRPVLGFIIAILFLALCFTPQMRSILTLPDSTKLVVGEKRSIKVELPAKISNRLEMLIKEDYASVFAEPQDAPVMVRKSATGYEILALKPGRAEVTLKVLGYVPVKTIEVESVPVKRVVLGGHSIGVLLQSNGIMVVGFAPIITDEGEKISPAREQGVEIGDLIMAVDGYEVKTENDLARIIDSKKDETFSLRIKREDKIISLPVKGYFCRETGRYRIGLYVRDGVIGVGTLSFWDPESKVYAALGHIIIDADTKQGIDVLKGKIMSASVQTIKPGRPGRPGEKIGVFASEGEIAGNIIKNTLFGIYGQTEGEVRNPLYDYAIEVGYAHQVKKGPAEMYTVVNGDSIEKFAIEIEKVYPERQNGKGMIIRVTDPRLLSLTGGIIQGMSGSPIVQDGKIIGAVTHVFLNDPTRGYGVFMDNMLAELEDCRKENNKVSTN
ncbi:SpoIVB peptidase [Thermosyntropha lipolytica]|uniref:SpoIVB peptidase n=1 Tax=Thermosyntropha lipolytica TaxID=54294 RepID=UPI0009323134|nr:SpoIVB peptidase [Thermosyntropha lipolytica]